MLVAISFSSPLNTNENIAKGAIDGCVGAPGDNDGDGDLCDPGETMFNCTPDCLPAGIPTKSVEDVLDDTIKWVLGFGLMIAVTFLIWGSIHYVASSGDDRAGGCTPGRQAATVYLRQRLLCNA